MSLSSEHAHLVLVWGDSELDSPELTLPKKVTTAKKGPLSLNTGTEHLGTGRRRLTYPSHTHLALTPDRSNSLPLSSILRERRRSSVTKYPVQMLEPSHTHLALTPDRSNSLPLSSILRQRRRSSVTKYPVEMLERPIELVEKELGTLSCAQLKDSLQDWSPHAPWTKLPPVIHHHHHNHSTGMEHQHRQSNRMGMEQQHSQSNRMGMEQSNSIRLQQLTQLAENSSTAAPMNITITYNNKHKITPLTFLPTPPTFTSHILPTPPNLTSPSHTPDDLDGKPNTFTNISILSSPPLLPPPQKLKSLTTASTAATGHFQPHSRKLPLPKPHPSLPTTCTEHGHTLTPSKAKAVSGHGAGGGGTFGSHKLNPLLNNKTILKGRGLAITQKSTPCSVKINTK